MYFYTKIKPKNFKIFIFRYFNFFINKKFYIFNINLNYLYIYLKFKKFIINFKNIEFDVYRFNNKFF